MRRLGLFFAFAGMLVAANQRLYFKEGDYELVREYEIKGDRVRYFSVDGNQWEEIPLELVDLKKTEKEAGDKAKSREETIRIEKAEDDAIKADKKQVASVPQTAGVYLSVGTDLKALTEIDAFRRDSSVAKILQRVAPAPVVPGKATIYVEGKAAKFRITEAEPEFFFRLAQQERLSLIRLEVKKDERIVETVVIPQQQTEDMPLTEDQKVVESFKKQYEPLLYKIWPQQPLPPGEYAIVEYTEGQINPRVWDFGVDKAK
jgi:hypothetical protein